MLYCLIHSDEQAAWFCKKTGLPLEQLAVAAANTYGLTQYFTHSETGDEMCIVRLNLSYCAENGGVSAATLGTLAHEAMHVWRHFMEYIGEKEPSEEFAAYSYGQIYENLAGEFLRAVRD